MFPWCNYKYNTMNNNTTCFFRIYYLTENSNKRTFTLYVMELSKVFLIFQPEPKIAKTRSLHSRPEPLSKVKIDKKREPVFEDFSDVVKQPEEVSKFEAILLLWTILRKQIIPPFSGYTVQEQSISINASDLKKNNLTYLPPINSPIAHYDTIYELFKTLQTTATITKMRYVNLTLDAGAYVNAYRVLCNYPKVFSNLILHLGDFHYMKELFGIVGTLVKASGLEDIIFQAGVCSTGSLNGVLAGSHYNRCWTVHTAMAEALERLLLELLLSTGHHIPTVLQCFYGKNDDNSKSSCINLIYHEDVINFQQSYVKFQQNIRDGLHGKTAQFWMVNYIDIIRFLHQIHYSVQTNNYDLRLDGFASLSTNKTMLDMDPFT